MFKWGRTWKYSRRRTKFYNSFTTGLLTERYDSKQWTIHFCREKKNFFYFTKQLNSFELYGRLNTSWSKNFTLSIHYTVCIKESSTIRRNHASKEYSRISVSEPRQFWTFWSIVRPRVDYLIQRFQRRIVPPIRWTIPFDLGVNRSLLFLETILETNGISMESCGSAKL